MDFEVVSILALVLGIIATVLAFIFIVPSNKRDTLNAFGKFVHDAVNFKFLIVEKIMQALYIFSTAFIMLTGFFLLFAVDYRDDWMGGYGLLTMILGPIAVRLSYEFLMMFILLIKNVIQINNKLKQEGEAKDDIFATPVAPVQMPQAAFCPNCGTKGNAGEFCANCGTKI